MGDELQGTGEYLGRSCFRWSHLGGLSLLVSVGVSPWAYWLLSELVLPIHKFSSYC